MPMKGEPKTARRRPNDSSTAWFAVLEHARRTNNFELAARAQRELRRLGVDVKFRRTDQKETSYD